MKLCRRDDRNQNPKQLTIHDAVMSECRNERDRETALLGRLIEMLNRKGILTDNDVLKLLPAYWQWQAPNPSTGHTIPAIKPPWVME